MKARFTSLGVAALLCSLPVNGAAAANEHVVGLWLLPKGKPNGAVMAAIGRSFTALGKGSPNVEVLREAAMRKRLRRNPKALLNACGPRLACIARLGRRAKVDEAIVIRAAPDSTTPKAVVLQYLVVGSASKKLERKGKLVITTPDRAEAILLESFADIFGRPFAPPPAVATAPAEPPLPAPPLDPLSQTPASAPAATTTPEESDAQAPTEVEPPPAPKSAVAEAPDVDLLKRQMEALAGVLNDTEQQVHGFENQVRVQLPDGAAALATWPEPTVSASDCPCTDTGVLRTVPKQRPANDSLLSAWRGVFAGVGAAAILSGALARVDATSKRNDGDFETALNTERYGDIGIAAGSALIASAAITALVDGLWVPAPSCPASD